LSFYGIQDHSTVRLVIEADAEANEMEWSDVFPISQQDAAHREQGFRGIITEGVFCYFQIFLFLSHCYFLDFINFFASLSR
jgi:hypothetical protein